MATQTTVEKWKSKQWFNVYTPKLFGEKVIGEIPAGDEKAVVGRVIKVSLAWITQRPEHSYILIGLKITGSDGNAAHTELSYVEQTYSYIHSLVRRQSSAIYTVDRLKDSTGKGFTLKLLVLTRGKIATPKKTAIRSTISGFVSAYASKLALDDFIREIMDGKFQDEGRKELKNIASVGRLELKRLEL